MVSMSSSVGSPSESGLEILKIGKVAFALSEPVAVIPRRQKGPPAEADCRLWGKRSPDAFRVHRAEGKGKLPLLVSENQQLSTNTRPSLRVYVQAARSIWLPLPSLRPSLAHVSRHTRSGNEINLGGTVSVRSPLAAIRAMRGRRGKTPFPEDAHRSRRCSCHLGEHLR